MNGYSQQDIAWTHTHAHAIYVYIYIYINDKIVTAMGIQIWIDSKITFADLLAAVKPLDECLPL